MNFQVKRPCYFSALLAILLAPQMMAQEVKPDSSRSTEKPLSLTAIDRVPEFPGGNEALYAYLSDKLTYPDSAATASIGGRVVASFIILGDGNIADISIVETPGYGLSEEVIRVLKSMPRWKPGMKDGKVVSVYFALPVFFTPPSDVK